MPAGRKKGSPKTGGRKKGTPNKSTQEIKAAAQKHGMAVINALVELMNTSGSDQVKISAGRELLDRGYGKPVAQVAHTGKDDGPIKIEDMSNLEIARRMAFVFDLARREQIADMEPSHTEH